MDNIKIVRFKDSIDVICKCIFDKKDYAYDLYEPMMFDISHKGQLVLQHWLPMNLMKEQFVRIKEEDILCIYDPEPKFLEYYSNITSKMNSVIDSLEDDSSNMELIMEAMEQLGSNKSLIH
jgi:hypothetical protein